MLQNAAILSKLILVRTLFQSCQISEDSETRQGHCLHECILQTFRRLRLCTGDGNICTEGWPSVAVGRARLGAPYRPE